MSRLLACLIALLPAAVVAARTPDLPPPGRLVKAFDFDERPMGNLEETPMRWAKVVGEGYPHWVRGRLAEADGRGGGWGFTLSLDGGSVAYRLAPGVVRARAGSRYRLEVYCRTDRLAHARALLTARVVDADGRTVPGTLARSKPHLGGEWTLLEAEVAVPSDVVGGWVVPELALLQPEMLASGEADDAVETFKKLPGDLGRVMLQDVGGSATFDDLSVVRVPHLTLGTDHLANVFPADATPAVTLDLRDDRTSDLTGLLRVTDARGAEVLRRSGPVRTLAGALPVGRVPVTTPGGGALLPGWYRASLTIFSDDPSVPKLIERAIDVVVLSEEPWRVRPDGRFGLDAAHVPSASWAGLAGLFREIGAGRALVPVWGVGGFGDTPSFEATLGELRRAGVRADAVLTATPDGRVWDATDPGPWREHVNRLAARHAGQLDSWQFGDADAATMWTASPDPTTRVNALRDTLRPLTGTPQVMLPWPAFHELPVGAGDVSLRVPTAVLPGQIGTYLDDHRGRGLGEPAVRLDTLTADDHGELRQWRDLALRIGHALAAGTRRVDLPAPVTAGPDGRLTPHKLLLPMRTLLKNLAGSRCFGEVPIGLGDEKGVVGHNVRGLIFERPKPGGRTGERDGVLMIWSDVGRVPVEVDVTVGGTPEVIRLDGTRKPLATIDGRVSVTAGPMPILLVGGDVELARLRASVAIDRPTIPPEFGNHARVVTLTNTYPYHLLADVDIDGPAGWTIDLPRRRLSLAPGETASLPVTVRFPYNATTGRHRLAVRVMPDDGHELEAPLDIRLGDGDVTLSTLALVEGDDLVVQQLVTNYGDAPVRYDAFVHLPGRPRQERLLVDLEPGGTAVKKYHFDDAADLLPAELRSGLIELEGSRVINEKLTVE